MRRVSWRKLLAACAAVLLPVPLVLLLVGVLRPDTPPGARISPVLDNEQRARLITYGRHCGPDEACETPLGCLLDARHARSYCTDSRCETDAQCPQSEVCRLLPTWADGPNVRFCVPVGPRQEGESCVRLPRDKRNSCAEGLLCAGRGGWCARPCRPGSDGECPEGFFCADTVPQPVCLPTCEKRGCPTGQQCIPFEEGASVCAQVYGPNCLQAPCPEGRKCAVEREPPHPGKVWMECVERCGEVLPPCGTGKVCDGYHCSQACDPRGPAVCAEGYHCSRRGENEPYSCQPLYWDEEMVY